MICNFLLFHKKETLKFIEQGPGETEKPQNQASKLFLHLRRRPLTGAALLVTGDLVGVDLAAAELATNRNNRLPGKAENFFRQFRLTDNDFSDVDVASSDRFLFGSFPISLESGPRLISLDSLLLPTTASNPRTIGLTSFALVVVAGVGLGDVDEFSRVFGWQDLAKNLVHSGVVVAVFKPVVENLKIVKR